MPLSSGSTDVARAIKFRLNVLLAATVLLYAVVVIAVLVTFAFSQKTHEALCTFRGDLQQRVTQTQTYLDRHPEGFPGVSVATIQQGLENQRRTIAALGPLGCGN